MKLFNKKEEPGISRKRNLIAVMTIVVAVLIFSGGVWGSSGGEHEAKGWVATDTYKVMNFTVLVVALFFLLRKPVAQALNGRIKGIKDQIDELEAKKKDAEKKLAEYNEKLSLLDKEAEQIVAEYIKQGNEAKARILKEAEGEAVKLEEHAKRNIAYGCRDTFGAILASGITILIFWQIFINIGMVMGLMPVVGVPLPFILSMQISVV